MNKANSNGGKKNTFYKKIHLLDDIDDAPIIKSQSKFGESISNKPVMSSQDVSDEDAPPKKRNFI